jgi:transposase
MIFDAIPPSFQLDSATKAWVAALCDAAQKDAQRITVLEKELRIKEEEIRNNKIKIDALSYELAWHKRIQFDKKSEAFTGQQRDLFDETEATDIAAIEAELEALTTTPAAPKPRAKPTGRKPLPADLPRVDVRHEPDSCDCGQCGKTLGLVREDITEQLDVEPAKFSVIRHIRPQYACRACETITAAPISPAIIDGGMATARVYAWVMVQKYVDHLPLYRIEGIALRSGIQLSRSTLANWAGKIGVALQPLADRLVTLLKEENTLHADETPVAQLDPGQGKTKRAYLWAYRSNDLASNKKIVIFDYQPSRAAHHAKTFLGNWQGHLMVDDYAGYKALFKQGITELACLAHIRRKFFDLHAANANPVAALALERIRALYDIEREAKDCSVEERQRLRQEKSLPLCEEMEKWFIKIRLTTADGCALARALDYAIKRWAAVMRTARHGHLPIDNNAVENAIRPIAIGKKNWLFAGSERAGKRAAAIQSLFATAKLNGLDPLAWLTTVLEKLPTCKNNQLDSLLPLAEFSP